MRISVIIPTLDEETHIGRAVKSASAGAFEIIVADGGSSDKTIAVARGAGAVIIKTNTGRGRQMDAGAKTAKGDVLLFLHADSTLPSGWEKSVKTALSDANVIAGAFSLSIDAKGFAFRLIERGANARARLLNVIYGDQAIFARKSAFVKTGGFKSLPLMEDVDYVRRLRRAGKLIMLPDRVKTSPRRWLGNGRYALTTTFWRTFNNWLILGLYLAGWRAETLYRLYYGKNPAR